MTILIHDGEPVLFRSGAWHESPTALVALVNGGEAYWVELTRQALSHPELPFHVLCKSWVDRDDFAAAYRHACARVGVPQEVVAANLALAHRHNAIQPHETQRTPANDSERQRSNLLINKEKFASADANG